jgi:hypothetical protein
MLNITSNSHHLECTDMKFDQSSHFLGDPSTLPFNTLRCVHFILSLNTIYLDKKLYLPLIGSQPLHPNFIPCRVRQFVLCNLAVCYLLLFSVSFLSLTPIHSLVFDNSRTLSFRVQVKSFPFHKPRPEPEPALSRPSSRPKARPGFSTSLSLAKPSPSPGFQAEPEPRKHYLSHNLASRFQQTLNE